MRTKYPFFTHHHHPIALIIPPDIPRIFARGEDYFYVLLSVLTFYWRFLALFFLLSSWRANNLRFCRRQGLMGKREGGGVGADLQSCDIASAKITYAPY
ncbi:hypothetical protein CDAR_168461 [Caerostris darwini]|uniref:Uncharacterized protein n=1 Tax=Caerostris darwini TaxID=1538125 RepID=A0AAV4T3W8_9ARAC|nr:hypothetical protein CDAR_168461 [Caerostris darwini]